MEDYVLYTDFHKKFRLEDYGFFNNYNKINYLMENGEIEGKKINNKLYVSIESMHRHMKKFNMLQNDYMSIEEFNIKLTEKNNTFRKHNIMQFEQVGIEILKLDFPIQKNGSLVYYLINKNSVEQFLHDYISLENAFYKYKPVKVLRSFKDYLKRHGVDILVVIKSPKYQYVKKEIVEPLLDKIEKSDVMKGLGVDSDYNFSQILKNYNFRTIRAKIRADDTYNKYYLSKKEYEFLKEEQIRTLKQLEEKTYTLEDIYLLLNKIGTVKPNTKFLKKLVYLNTIPPIARTGKYKGKATLFDKRGVDRYVDHLRNEKEISNLYNAGSNDYFEIFQQSVQIEDIQFSNNSQITEELWYQFVKWKLKNMGKDEESCKKRVTSFRNSSKVLAKLTMSKEIHMFSEIELNLGIFNQNVAKNYQSVIYSFLLNVNQLIEEKSGKKIFDLSKLNFKNNGSTSTMDKKQKEIYPLEEYLSLYNYVKDHTLHKKYAIESLKKALNNSDLTKNKQYNKYDSMWLYVILHMCNGWRHGDVIEFPRFPLEPFNKLNIDSIEELERLQLSYDDAAQIVKYFQMQWFDHNKTKEKATFYCSSELTLAMAYAIIICEFRCKQFHLKDQTNLIHFYNTRNKFSLTTHEAFFKSFNGNFKFKSKKMNTSVLVYTGSVIENSFDAPIKVAQHLRGHTSTETTNIYFQIPQEQLDFITEQLFDTGYFGYVYSEMNNLLIGKSPKNRLELTQQSKEIKKLFGDVVKVEDMISYLNQLSHEEREVCDYLAEMPKEQLKERLNLINLGLSPAKEQAYQCLFAECIAKDRVCNMCPFSIPHFYALSTICKRIVLNLSRYKVLINDSQIPEGEKTKLFNFLLKDYRSIYEAKQKFGSQIIEMLIDYKMDEFVEEFHLLPEPQL